MFVQSAQLEIWLWLILELSCSLGEFLDGLVIPEETRQG